MPTPLPPLPVSKGFETDLPQAIGAEQFRVGWFVRVALPWSAHPFSVSDFRIASEAQLAAVRSLTPGSVRPAPADADVALGRTPMSFHAPQVLAALHELQGASAAGADADADADPDADPDNVCRFDPALCRQQLVEAAAELAALPTELPALHVDRDAAPLLGSFEAGPFAVGSAGSATYRATAGESAPADPGLPIDATQAAGRLAGALATKLTGVPSAYIRALCEDAAAQPATERAFPRTLHAAVLTLLLARAARLAEAPLHAVLLGVLLRGARARLPAAGLWRPTADVVNFTDSAADARQDQPVAPCTETGGRAGWPAAGQQLLVQRRGPADKLETAGRLPMVQRRVASQIVALVDRYHERCNPVPPAAGVAPHEALAELTASDRGLFDAPLLRTFVQLMGAYPPGSLARLSDERYARVVANRRRRALRPPLRLAGETSAVDRGLLAPPANDAPAHVPHGTRAELSAQLAADWLSADADSPFSLAEALTT